ncbi:MAG: helix-hairpin-helix domain-containing protein [Patescibacteria group bacterium]
MEMSKIKQLSLSFILGIVVGVLGFLIVTPSKKCDPVVFTKVGGCEDVKGVLSEIVVDVSGAVVNPGIYKFPQESRISDAIKSAGGVLEDKVNKEYLSKNVNLAQVLQDSAKVYIPFEGDLSQTYHFGSGTSVSGGVNINTASESELDSKLTGIGPVYAKKIVDNRPYSKIEELYEKNIIPKATFEKIKGEIVVN